MYNETRSIYLSSPWMTSKCKWIKYTLANLFSEKEILKGNLYWSPISLLSTPTDLKYCYSKIRKTNKKQEPLFASVVHPPVSSLLSLPPVLTLFLLWSDICDLRLGRVLYFKCESIGRYPTKTSFISAKLYFQHTVICLRSICRCLAKGSSRFSTKNTFLLYVAPRLDLCFMRGVCKFGIVERKECGNIFPTHMFLLLPSR